MTSTGNHLGLVIDLTDTDRYYDPQALTATLQSDYTKLKFPGSEDAEIDEQLVARFITRVNAFLQANATNDLLIGVHCTHGVNRTGYMIGRYLVEQCGCTSHQALEAFRKARGYPIERAKLVTSLHAISREVHSHRPPTGIASSRRPDVEAEDEIVAEFAPHAAAGGKRREGGSSGVSNFALLEELFASSQPVRTPPESANGPDAILTPAHGFISPVRDQPDEPASSSRDAGHRQPPSPTSATGILHEDATRDRELPSSDARIPSEEEDVLSTLAFVADTFLSPLDPRSRWW